MTQEIDLAREDRRIEAQHDIFLALRNGVYNCGFSIDDLSEELVNFYEPEEVDYLVRRLNERNSNRPAVLSDS